MTQNTFLTHETIENKDFSLLQKLEYEIQDERNRIARNESRIEYCSMIKTAHRIRIQASNKISPVKRLIENRITLPGFVYDKLTRNVDQVYPAIAEDGLT